MLGGSVNSEKIDKIPIPDERGWSTHNGRIGDGIMRMNEIDFPPYVQQVGSQNPR